MPYASRLVDSVLIERPSYSKDDVGQKISAGRATIGTVACQLQLRNVSQIMEDFGEEISADAVIYLLGGQDVQPRVGDGDAATNDRMTVTQQDGTVTVWQARGSKHLPGHVAVAVAHATTPA